jgi:DNA polymerase-3 subunit delta'
MTLAAARAFDDVVGQHRAVAQLQAAAASPVHAYLFVGPPGSGKRRAAVAFAMALLCPDGGCGECRCCRLVRDERHPDLAIVEPEGAFLMVKQADAIITRASLSPAEGRRNVLVLDDFHLVHPQAAPKLLKIVEEPPERTVFLILTEHVPSELETIASRCVRVDFGGLAPDVLAHVLVEEGVDAAAAAEVAALAGGRLDRARLLASDTGFAARRELWRSLPGRLDGSGAAVAVAVEDIGRALDGAAEVLAATQSAERGAIAERQREAGERAGTSRLVSRSARLSPRSDSLAGPKEITDRHKRELRRLRADELRFGLATLAGVYRDAMVSGEREEGIAAVALIQRAAEALVRNPSEGLLLQALLVRLSALR